MTDIQWKEASNYLKYYEEKGNSDNSIYEKAKCIRRFAKWLWEKEIMDNKEYRLINNHLQKYREGECEPREALTEEQKEHTLKKVKNPLFRMIVWFGWNFGLRAWELCNLLISDVDFENKWVVVQWKTAKGRKSRKIPLNKNQERILKNWINHLRNDIPVQHDFVFYSITGKPLKHATLTHILKKVQEEIGIHLYAHKLRYTYAVTLWRNGMDIYIISKMLGHAKIETTERYLKVKEKEYLDKYRDSTKDTF